MKMKMHKRKYYESFYSILWKTLPQTWNGREIVADVLYIVWRGWLNSILRSRNADWRDEVSLFRSGSSSHIQTINSNNNSSSSSSSSKIGETDYQRYYSRTKTPSKCNSILKAVSYLSCTIEWHESCFFVYPFFPRFLLSSLPPFPVSSFLLFAGTEIRPTNSKLWTFLGASLRRSDEDVKETNPGAPCSNVFKRVHEWHCNGNLSSMSMWESLRVNAWLCDCVAFHRVSSSIHSHCIVLHCIALHCIVLYCIVLRCILFFQSYESLPWRKLLLSRVHHVWTTANWIGSHGPVCTCTYTCHLYMNLCIYSHLHV